MKKITDEILNDYIDNQLNSEALEEFNNIISSDEEALVKLKALKMVDQSLNSIEVYHAPEGFTQRVMNKIFVKSKAALPNIKRFFISVVGLFTIAIISVMIAAYSAADTAEGGIKLNFLDTAKKFVEENGPSVLKFFSNQNILMIGLALTMILLISGFFLLESHKNFKNKLNKIS
jgi:low affinity Fe/Cu permease